QTYPGLKDHEAHFYCLLRAFTDDRYLTVDGKPIFCIYRPWEIPDLKRVTDFWRELAHKAGLKGLHLVGEGLQPDQVQEFGFDASTYARHRVVEHFLPRNRIARRLVAVYRKAFRRPVVYSYRQAIPYFLREGESAINDYPSIVPNWDSTPRFGWRGVVLHNATPELFRIHVRQALRKVAHKPVEKRIIFIKSWNEWAEGNHLEPDLKYGRGHLEALRDELYRA
ncbi:MAG: lipopolysaccharide biosynthesis protein, partial [Chloroflexi bacterium]|nr:lipopolysaccharide biosynthesis protein [Chloroflexota bacterium]